MISGTMDIEDPFPIAASLRERAQAVLAEREESIRDHLLGVARKICGDVLWEALPDDAEVDTSAHKILFRIDDLDLQVRSMQFETSQEKDVLEVQDNGSWSRINELLDLGKILRKWDEAPTSPSPSPS